MWRILSAFKFSQNFAEHSCENGIWTSIPDSSAWFQAKFLWDIEQVEYFRFHQIVTTNTVYCCNMMWIVMMWWCCTKFSPPSWHVMNYVTHSGTQLHLLSAMRAAFRHDETFRRYLAVLLIVGNTPTLSTVLICHQGIWLMYRFVN